MNDRKRTYEAGLSAASSQVKTGATEERGVSDDTGAMEHQDNDHFCRRQRKVPAKACEPDVDWRECPREAHAVQAMDPRPIGRRDDDPHRLNDAARCQGLKVWLRYLWKRVHLCGQWTVDSGQERSVPVAGVCLSGKALSKPGRTGVAVASVWAAGADKPDKAPQTTLQNQSKVTSRTRGPWTWPIGSKCEAKTGMRPQAFR
jgi:hypothetical protein